MAKDINEEHLVALQVLVTFSQNLFHFLSSIEISDLKCYFFVTVDKKKVY